MRTVLLLTMLVLMSCTPTEFTLLQANVGNAELSCAEDAFKLCHQDVLERIRDNIAVLKPDVVTFQEIRPTTPGNQVTALLGADYDYACDDRSGYECVAIRRSAGALVGSYRLAPPVELDNEPCDDGFSVGSQRLELAGKEVQVINAHPMSTNEHCRGAQVDQMFGLVDAEHVVVAGDMNLDPFGYGFDDNDESVPVWNRYVQQADDASDDQFIYASGPAERLPPYPTTTVIIQSTLDHVAIRGLSGTCQTLGRAPGTTRLDGGDGCDHLALSCALAVP
jgi:endonuclease/exonuclease/phosphatase family metal-dependent hydrolase